MCSVFFIMWIMKTWICSWNHLQLAGVEPHVELNQDQIACVTLTRCESFLLKARLGKGNELVIFPSCQDVWGELSLTSQKTWITVRKATLFLFNISLSRLSAAWCSLQPRHILLLFVHRIMCFLASASTVSAAVPTVWFSPEVCFNCVSCWFG